MRIKIISHDKMVHSVNYLYNKLEKENAIIYPSLSYHNTSESFINKVKENIENYKITGKECNINPSIKHAVVTFHPNDASKLNRDLDLILNETIDKIGIDRENMNLTAFIHNDRLHPHVHLIWTRIGDDGTIFKDNKLGWKLNDIAKEMDKKHALSTPSKSMKLSLTDKELYNPTNRSTLLQLLYNATAESTSKNQFLAYLKGNNIARIKTKSNETIYVLNNNDNANRIVVHENTLPSIFRDQNLLKTINSQVLSPTEKSLRETLKENISKCNSLNDVKSLFPGCRMQYQKQGNTVYNLKIHTNQAIVSLSDINISSLTLETKESTENILTQKITNFNPLYIKPTNNHDEIDYKQLAKNKKRKREIGLKNQL